MKHRATHLPWYKKLTFGLVPLLLLLTVGELVARLDRGRTFWSGNFRLLRLEQVRRGYPAVNDPVLGYVPRPSYSGRDNFWGTQVTIDGDGFRSNGTKTVPDRETIVAVGDSFTFGDQVDDGDTWPAYLERLLGREVKNGGVFGYSLGQIVLRAEQILQATTAEWLIVAFIPGDIYRCEFSKRYTVKPYFDVEHGELVLRNVPVPQPRLTRHERRERRWKNALGFSALLDSLFAHNLKAWWYMNEKAVRVHPPGRGAELAPLLVDRIASRCVEGRCKLLLVALGPSADEGADALMRHARSRGIRVLDLIRAFGEEASVDPSLRQRYYDGHLTAEGNRWVATRISEHIRAADRAERQGRHPRASDEQVPSGGPIGAEHVR